MSGRLAYVQRALVRRLGEMGDGRVPWTLGGGESAGFIWYVVRLYMVRATDVFGTC